MPVVNFHVQLHVQLELEGQLEVQVEVGRQLEVSLVLELEVQVPLGPATSILSSNQTTSGSGLGVAIAACPSRSQY